MSELQSLSASMPPAASPQPQGYTIRIPKFSAIKIESLFLVLLIGLALLQTFELFAIQRASANVSAGAGGATNAASGSGNNGALPQMVGGC